MQTIELNDIQGYVIDNYDRMMFSRYLLLKVEEKAKAKKWLGQMAFELTRVSTAKEGDTALNLAVTNTGLEALGLDQENRDAFSMEFREGMVTDHRSRMLGDKDGSSPEHWSWGNSKKPVHMLLMVFGLDRETASPVIEEIESNLGLNGLSLVENIDGLTLDKNKEHFGFRDGISQPIIKGSGVNGPKNDIINTGEFILGYENEYDVIPQSPVIKKDQGNVNLLPSDIGGSGCKDLGRNGSYLVLRQMDQDVDAFWSYMNEKSKGPDGAFNEKASLKLASKMIGRWPSGAPLALFPDEDPGGISNENDFGYAHHDDSGAKCPFGSHLRRLNPRDSFEDNNSEMSWKLTRKHRLMRRSRLYGEPIVGSPTNHKPKDKVGILFHGFNADISRQFEFIQYTWARIPTVKNLYNDPDPLVGTLESPSEGHEQNFTVQGEPVNKTVKGLQRFVTVRGGAYFFFPSITAVRYLSTI